MRIGSDPSSHPRPEYSATGTVWLEHDDPELARRSFEDIVAGEAEMEAERRATIGGRMVSQESAVDTPGYSDTTMRGYLLIPSHFMLNSPLYLLRSFIFLWLTIRTYSPFIHVVHR